jgi:hypothetical protein
VLAASGVPAATVAPAEAWVTLIEWAPTVRPAPAATEARPSAAPPEPTRMVPEATTSSVEATVPCEIWVEPVASWSTASVTEPAWDPEEMVPVAMDELDELAEKASS